MQKIDPITLEVVRGFLISTVYQMRATLMRTAYAPILYETRDFSCGLLTAGGELAAMAEDFSGHVFAMALGLNDARAKFGGDIHQGDVLAVNDPYTGGTHMNDIAFYTPFFVDGKILLYIGVRAHHEDVGGATPGSFSGQDTEIYQEGMRIVPVKLIDKGVLNQGLWDVLFANMRLSDERRGDALAMLDTGHVAEGALQELCRKYGPEVVSDCVDVLLDSAEETMRARISSLEDGQYHYEHYLDSGGLSLAPVPVKAKLDIDADRMRFDFTGTAPQVDGPMNCGIPVTRGGVFVVVKTWLDPKTPINGGSFRPMEFAIPEGSCLAAKLPAAVGGCWEMFRQVQSAAVGLLSQVMPDDLGGETMGTSTHVYVSGYDPERGKTYILYEYPQAGYAAASGTDGATGCTYYDAGDVPSVYPAESAEQRQPVMIDSLTVRTDGEGPGRYRSGFGITRQVRVLSDASQLNVMADRAIIPPWGAGGAPAGNTNSFTVIRDGSEVQPSAIPGKVKSFPLRKGDVVLMKATAGGGVGDPLERDPEMVLKDVLDGYVTKARARDTYGVVVDGNDEVDVSKTRERRLELEKRRRYLQVGEGESDDYDERGCRLYVVNSESAARLGVRGGDMVELVSGATAALRAWITIDDEAEAQDEVVWLGPVGRSILKTAPGDRVWVNRLNVEAPAEASNRRA